MEDLKARLAAHEATLGAVQETLHRIDRALDRIGLSTEGTNVTLASQSTRADGADLRMLSFRESFEAHIKDDAIAFRRIDDKFETLKDFVLHQNEQQTMQLMQKIDGLGSFKLKWQGATIMLATIAGWVVTLFSHKIFP